ncbi:MAG: YceI family protein [Kineosporiaceae bacterium]
MSIPAGTHRLGPDDATLAVRTKRTGAAAMAGHNLVIHVTAWEATLAVGEDPATTSIELAVDATSLRVHEGHGGAQALDDDDKANIQKTIDDEILKRQDVTFRSTRVESAGNGGRLSVRGDLTIAGTTHPIEFDVRVDDDGTLSASAVVTQTAWGMKPYSALFGALKVADDVEVVLDGHLEPQSR